MKYSKQIITGLLGALLAFSSTSFADIKKIDHSPEQLNRARSQFDQTRANEVKNARFVKDGYLTIGISTASTLPLHDYASDSKTIIGFDVDLALALADSLGKKLELVSVAWADWPLGLASGKFDAVISNVTVTEDRKKKFDFATYRKDDLGIYVAKDSPIKSITEPKDIAGLRVITDSGTNQELILLEWDRQNIEAGLPPVQVQYYDDKVLQTLAIASNRADVIFSVNALQSYLATVSGKTKHVGTVNGGWPLTAEIGVAFPKGSDLTKPIANLINDYIESGLYQEILSSWALESEAIEQSLINPPGLQ